MVFYSILKDPSTDYENWILRDNKYQYLNQPVLVGGVNPHEKSSLTNHQVPYVGEKKTLKPSTSSCWTIVVAYLSPNQWCPGPR